MLPGEERPTGAVATENRAGRQRINDGTCIKVHDLDRFSNIKWPGTDIQTVGATHRQRAWPAGKWYRAVEGECLQVNDGNLTATGKGNIECVSVLREVHALW